MQYLLVLLFKIMSFAFKLCLCSVQSLMFPLQELKPRGSAAGAELLCAVGTRNPWEISCKTRAVGCLASPNAQHQGVQKTM